MNPPKVLWSRKPETLLGLGFRVQGLGFKVQGLGFRVQGLGFSLGFLADSWEGAAGSYQRRPETFDFVCRVKGLGLRELRVRGLRMLPR